MRKLVNTVLAGALGLSMIVGVSAQEVGDEDSGSATVNVVADETNVYSVTISSAVFEDVVYGFAQSETGGLVSITVEDNTGNAEGWVVTIYGEDLDSESTGDIIPIGNLSFVAAAENPLESNAGQNTDGITQPGAPTGVPSEAGEATVILSADEGAGSGNYTAQYDATLVVPGGTLVGEYDGSLIVSMDAAP